LDNIESSYSKNPQFILALKALLIRVCELGVYGDQEMDARAAFVDVLKSEFATKLRGLGFSGSGKHFRRVDGEIVHAINIQASKHGDSCAVNLGLHLTFLPVNWRNALPHARKITVIDCEFRMRLSPEMKSDYWWKYGDLMESPTQSARHLIATYLECGEPYFQQYGSIEKIAAMISVDEIKQGSYVHMFGGITPVRAALAMARIHLHWGHTIESKQFAEVGLANIGAANLLRREFESILAIT
jgi:hypothetical protein